MGDSCYSREGLISAGNRGPSFLSLSLSIYIYIDISFYFCAHCSRCLSSWVRGSTPGFSSEDVIIVPLRAARFSLSLSLSLSLCFAFSLVLLFRHLGPSTAIELNTFRRIVQSASFLPSSPGNYGSRVVKSNTAHPFVPFLPLISLFSAVLIRPTFPLRSSLSRRLLINKKILRIAAVSGRKKSRKN